MCAGVGALAGSLDDVMSASPLQPLKMLSLRRAAAATALLAGIALLNISVSLSGHLVGGVHHGRDGEGQRHLPRHRPYPSGGLS